MPRWNYLTKRNWEGSLLGCCGVVRSRCMANIPSRNRKENIGHVLQSEVATVIPRHSDDVTRQRRVKQTNLTGAEKQ